MRLSGLLLPLLTALLPACLARSSTGPAVLVVLEPALKKEDYSIFFKSLEDRGYTLTFRQPKDAEPLVFEYDVPQYAHIIFFTPTTKSFAPDLSPQNLYHLLRVEPTTNFIIALGSKTNALSNFAAEFALGLPPANTPLVSHFPPRDTLHSIVSIDVPAESHPLLSPNMSPILFEGQAHILGDNPLVFPILNAPAESYCTESTEDIGADSVIDANERGGEGLWAGSKLSVASGFQATNGARVSFVGGVKVFSDEFAQAKLPSGQKTGNAEFVRDISAWTFQETLVFKIQSAAHFKAGDPTRTQLDRYTTNDQLTFGLLMTVYQPSIGKFAPISGLTDIQMDFTMLDPHVRKFLKPLPGNFGTYSVTFRAPDRHGVYKFVVDYKRKGFTPVHVAMPVAIVPPRHDGYPRFLSAAWPYYVGAFSTSLGFILFCVIYLGGEAAEERRRKEKGKGKVE